MLAYFASILITISSPPISWSVHPILQLISNDESAREGSFNDVIGITEASFNEATEAADLACGPIPHPIGRVQSQQSQRKTKAS
jgi:hypothetical protein